MSSRLRNKGYLSHSFIYIDVRVKKVKEKLPKKDKSIYIKTTH